MRRLFPFFVVALLTAPAGAYAAEHPGERRVAADAFIYLPITTTNIVLSLREISAASGVVIGFEAVPQEGSPEWRDAEKRQPSLRTWPVRGLLVSEALDMLASLDNRYGWREVDGVVNFRPTAALLDPNHFLNATVGSFELRHAVAIEAAFAVHRLFRADCEIRHPIYGTSDERAEYLAGLPPAEQVPMTLTLHNTTVLSVLNRVITAYRNMNWVITYAEGPATYEHGVFAFTSTLQIGESSRVCE